MEKGPFLFGNDSVVELCSHLMFGTLISHEIGPALTMKQKDQRRISQSIDVHAVHSCVALG